MFNIHQLSYFSFPRVVGNSLQLDIAPAKYFYHGIQFKSLKVDTKMLFHVDIPHIFFFLWGIIPSTIRINI